MPKVQFNVSIDAEVDAHVRDRARKSGVHLGDLVSLLMRIGSEQVTDEALATWAAKQETKVGRTGGAMTKREQKCFAALERLTARALEGAWRFEAGEVAAEAGLLRKDGYMGLKDLQARGLVKGIDGPELDRWQRPIQSLWNLPR